MRKNASYPKKLPQFLGNFINSRAFKVFVFGLGLLFAISLIRNIFTLRASEGKISDAQARLEGVEKQTQDLQKQLDEVESGNYREKQARDKLGLARQGETIVYLPDEQILRNIAPLSDSSDSEQLPLPNWQKWLELFVN